MCLRKSSAKIDQIGEIGERDFRLDHPELGEMPAGIGMFGAKTWGPNV